MNINGKVMNLKLWIQRKTENNDNYVTKITII